MRQEYYIYPAIFTYDDDGISIEFPDLQGCLSSAENDFEAVKNAKEALSLYLADLEDENKEMPPPSEISKIDILANQKVFPIDVWMPYHRGLIKTFYVKKTLTLPNWLNSLAEHQNVNFSQILQSALKEYLGIYETGKKL